MHDDENDDVIIDVEGDSTDDLSNDIRKPDGILCDEIEENARDMNDDDVFKIELIESVDEIVIDDDDVITQLFHNCFPIVVDILWTNAFIGGLYKREQKKNKKKFLMATLGMNAT